VIRLNLRYRIVCLLLAFLLVPAWAQKHGAGTQAPCTPEGSAGCTGIAINEEIARLEIRINSSYEKLFARLPREEPFDATNLPSKGQFKRLHVAWRRYVQEYCGTYRSLWPGASPWKSTQSRACISAAYEQYGNFLDVLGACADGKDGCERVFGDCAPTNCGAQSSNEPRRQVPPRP